MSQVHLYHFLLLHRRPPTSTLFPYTTLFRSSRQPAREPQLVSLGNKTSQVTAGVLGVGGARDLVGTHSGGALLHDPLEGGQDRKSTRLNSSHSQISYAVFCLKKKKSKNTLNS